LEKRKWIVFSFYSKYYLLIEKIHSSTDLLHPHHRSIMAVRVEGDFFKVQQASCLWMARKSLEKGENHEQL
jgi:hypothetical protein